MPLVAEPADSPSAEHKIPTGNAAPKRSSASSAIIPNFNALQRLESLFADGRFADCEALARTLIKQDAACAFAWKVLAASVAARGDLDGAIEIYERVPDALTNDWQFQNNFANTLKAMQRHDEAATRYRRAISLQPGTLQPVYNLGVTLIESGDLQAAEVCLRHALSLAPDHGLTHSNLANILNALDRQAEAEDHYTQALAAMPDDPRLLNNYGQLLSKMHRFAEAENAYRSAIALDPNFAHPCVNLSELMAAHGEVADAELLLRHALRLDPTLARAHSNLLFVMALRDNCEPSSLFAQHRVYAAQFEAPLKSAWPHHTNTRDPHRTLRVGFISGDLRDHPVVRYLMPALERLSRRDDLHLLAYNSGVQRDTYTERYRELFGSWRDVAMMPDAALAQRIMQDGVDILIDLSGHSGDNRMLTFARKPAPIAISWIGYVGTTGLDAMDYFVGDANLVPQAAQWQFREKILYLPATTTFQPFEPALQPNDLPALRNGYVTFCCAARINKLNQPLIALWARVLRSVPASRLLLLTLPGGNPPESVKAWFAVEGIATDRLIFAHARSVKDILLLHHHADLGLDTFPYNGSTTISHGLTMGVPTLTLRGDVPGARLGASIAAHVGIPQFIAATPDEFVDAAIHWSQNLAALSHLRSVLPTMFAESALCQHDQLADTLAQKLRTAWTRWCNNQPADHL